MSDAVAPPSLPLHLPQPMLFAELPEMARSGRAARRPRTAAGHASDAPPPVIIYAPPPEPPVFDPAALSNAEIRAMLEVLPDTRLAFLLGEAVRELKRRVLPPAGSEAETPPAPNPALLRAATAAAAELSGEDDCAADNFAPRSPPRGNGATSRGKRV